MIITSTEVTMPQAPVLRVLCLLFIDLLDFELLALIILFFFRKGCLQIAT